MGNICVRFYGGDKHFCTAVFCKKLEAACTQVRRLWIWIYPLISMDISIDIHGKSVDVDIAMDGKFHIHGKSAYTCREIKWLHQYQYC